jgi:hypothetical protein
MKNLSLIILLSIFPILSFAKAPDCYSWPMNMTKMWMRNARIVDFKNLEESKTKITLLASEKKGNTYEVITKSDSSYEECSISNVNSYLISKNYTSF